MDEVLAEKMAPILGAFPEEITICSTLTENIFKMLATFYQPTERKNKILKLQYEFPSDTYAIKSWLKQKGYDQETHCIPMTYSLNDAEKATQQIIEQIQ